MDVEYVDTTAALCCFLLQYIAVVVVLVRLWYSIRLIDMTLHEKKLIVTTLRPHGLRATRGLTCRADLLGTGQHLLDTRMTKKAFTVKVISQTKLELTGGSISDEVHSNFADGAIGRLDVHHPLLRIWKPLPAALLSPCLLVLVCAIIYLSKMKVPIAVLTIVAGTMLAAAYAASLRLYNYYFAATPLEHTLVRYRRQVLSQRGGFGRWPRPFDRGAARAICAGRIEELHLEFQDTIGDRSTYFVDTSIVRPLTEYHKLSFAELVGPAVMDGYFVVSHHWGSPFATTIASIVHHAQAKEPVGWKSSASYWMSLLSHNSWSREEAGFGGASGSGLYKAIFGVRCYGLCVVVDEEALPLTRAWCVLELLYSYRRSAGKHKGGLETGAGATYGAAYHSDIQQYTGVYFCTPTSVFAEQPEVKRETPIHAATGLNMDELLNPPAPPPPTHTTGTILPPAGSPPQVGKAAAADIKHQHMHGDSAYDVALAIASRIANFDVAQVKSMWPDDKRMLDSAVFLEGGPQEVNKFLIARTTSILRVVKNWRDTDGFDPRRASGWQCPSCNGKNLSEAVVCRHCNLERPTWECKRCETPNVAIIGTCSACGSMRPGDWGCTVCNFQNAEQTDTCARCRTARHGWTCPTCSHRNASATATCWSCNNIRPNWTCGQCQTVNVDTATHCQTCNMARPKWACMSCKFQNNANTDACQKCGRVRRNPQAKGKAKAKAGLGMMPAGPLPVLPANQQSNSDGTKAEDFGAIGDFMQSCVNWFNTTPAGALLGTGPSPRVMGREGTLDSFSSKNGLLDSVPADESSPKGPGGGKGMGPGMGMKKGPGAGPGMGLSAALGGGGPGGGMGPGMGPDAGPDMGPPGMGLSASPGMGPGGGMGAGRGGGMGPGMGLGPESGADLPPPGGFGDASPAAAPQPWTCTLCSGKNSASERSCGMCGSQKPPQAASAGLPGLPGVGGAAVGSAGAAQQWRCTRCSFLNAGSATSCSTCRTAKPAGAAGSQPAAAAAAAWTCSVCNVQNSASAAVCRSCRSRKPGEQGGVASAGGGQWRCQTCMSTNSATAGACSTCGSPKPSAPEPPPVMPNTPWSCSGCMFQNRGSAARCEVCQAPRPQPAAASSAQSYGAPHAGGQPHSGSAAQQPPMLGPHGSWFCRLCSAQNEAGNLECAICGGKRPVDDSWQCIGCGMKNASGSSNCMTCGSIKPPPAPARQQAMRSGGSSPSGHSPPRAPARQQAPASTWTCPACTMENTANNPSCDLCGSSKPASSMSTSPTNTVPTIRSQGQQMATTAASGWSCALCSMQNPSLAASCSACGTPKPASQPAGLASSASPASFGAHTHAASMGSNVGAQPAGGAPGGGAWVCSICTFDNDASTGECGACGSARA
eukprot:TRINITY_DN32899_c0_g1_i1.p1 TRINITY_DN32899_c0_g1~~TRINITY_DN32899_c0_g1_i1.p1  ORF type:complete len:1383 (+),score=148.76 TRINITY_DN32899_c0_g1_i1:212-4360(+)